MLVKSPPSRISSLTNPWFNTLWRSMKHYRIPYLCWGNYSTHLKHFRTRQYLQKNGWRRERKIYENLWYHSQEISPSMSMPKFPTGLKNILLSKIQKKGRSGWAYFLLHMLTRLLSPLNSERSVRGPENWHFSHYTKRQITEQLIVQSHSSIYGVGPWSHRLWHSK